MAAATAEEISDPNSKDPVERVSSKVQAVAVFCPGTDFLHFGQLGFNPTSQKELLQQLDLLGAFAYTTWDSVNRVFVPVLDETKRLEITRQISPAEMITADDAPAYIMHGDRDADVPLQQSQLMEEKLTGCWILDARYWILDLLIFRFNIEHQISNITHPASSITHPVSSLPNSGTLFEPHSKRISMGKLTGKKIAILTENGFEEVELTSPKKALEEAGAQVDIISPQQDKVKAWDHDHWSIELPVDVVLSVAKAEEYDALMIPGGVINPDKMRINKDCVEFAQHFLENGKPVAAICHGPQLLIETNLISGRNMTSYPSLKTDLENAGVIWEDKEVVTDNGLVTSRSPKDLDAFNKKMIEEIAEGTHAPAAYAPAPTH